MDRSIYEVMSLKFKMEAKKQKRKLEPVIEYSWEVSYDDDNFPIYGLDVFQSVAEAQHAAQAYIEEGKENVRLTFFEDGCAIETINY